MTLASTTPKRSDMASKMPQATLAQAASASSNCSRCAWPGHHANTSPITSLTAKTRPENEADFARLQALARQKRRQVAEEHSGRQEEADIARCQRHVGARCHCSQADSS